MKIRMDRAPISHTAEIHANGDVAMSIINVCQGHPVICSARNPSTIGCTVKGPKVFDSFLNPLVHIRALSDVQLCVQKVWVL